MREKCINTTTTRKFHLMNALGRGNIFLHFLANLKGKDRIKSTNLHLQEESLNFNLLSLKRSSVLE